MDIVANMLPLFESSSGLACATPSFAPLADRHNTAKDISQSEIRQSLPK
jgi:hypothetical protein